MKFCVVFVTNKAYFPKFLYTCEQLITKGNHHGEICLIVGRDLLNDHLLKNNLILDNKIIVKYFPDIYFSEDNYKIMRSLERSSHWNNKFFQFHKFYLFDIFFKQWDQIFYLDSGITIFSDISPMIYFKKKTFLAHSDAYPKYELKLRDQFDKSKTVLFNKLCQKYNLNVDYPQSTMMLFDTKIIKHDTFIKLVDLAIEFPISITNDQGIIALYFTNIDPKFEQIKLGNEGNKYYDYMKRNNTDSYIMKKI
jgi:hypothetical protein